MPILLSDERKRFLQVQEAVKCPYCASRSGTPCVNYNLRTISRPHKKRIEAYERAVGAPDYLERIRHTSPEDALIIDQLALAKVFFYDGSGVIMPSGRRITGEQMRLLVAAAGYNPLKPSRSFRDIGGGMCETDPS